MQKMVIILTAICMFAVAVSVSLLPLTTQAQTQNETIKSEVTDTFIFFNDCSNELMDVTVTSITTCHQQVKANGTFNEKCQTHEHVTAVGQTTGITFHGSSTFRGELTVADACNFGFTNTGGVRLISPGSDDNLILSFDDIVTVENCVMTTDIHLFSFDCRG